MPLVDRITEIPVIHNEDKFIALIESSLPYIRKDTETAYVPVDPQVAAKFRFDFYGLCTFLDIAPEYHFATMRINGLSSAQDFNGITDNILLPSRTAIDYIVEIALTKKE